MTDQREAQRQAVRRYRPKNREERDALNAAERERRATDPVYADHKRARTRKSVDQWKKLHPERAKAIAKKHYRAHATKYQQRAREYYWANREARKLYSKTRYHADKKTAQKKVREWQQKLKAEIFRRYGGHCQCCGETVLAFLTLDHAHGDGARHRESINDNYLTAGSTFYRWLQKAGFPQDLGLRVLCFNCNCGRRVNGGVCPHQLSHARNSIA